MHIILGQIHGLKEDHNARCQPLSLGVCAFLLLLFSVLLCIFVQWLISYPLLAQH
jgi:hypothetical protein